MALDSERQRFHALQEQEGVEGRECRAQVAQELDPKLDDEGGRAERLGVDQAVVRRVGRGELGKAGPRATALAQSNLPASTTTPPMAVPCPPIHLVAECTMMSAP